MLLKMITEVDLLKLKYRVITRLDDTDKTVEFVHQDLDDRSYLVKLRKGEVHTVYPSRMKRSCNTNSLDVLINWHHDYVLESELK